MALIAIVDDLFFAVKIREAARQTGVAVDVVGAAKFVAIFEKLAEGSVEAVILDLNSAAALEGIKRLKREEQTRSLPVIGFVSHVAGDVIAAARAAGCDRVLARSAFTKELPELLRSLSQGSGIRDHRPGSSTPTPEIRRLSIPGS